MNKECFLKEIKQVVDEFSFLEKINLKTESLTVTFKPLDIRFKYVWFLGKTYLKIFYDKYYKDIEFWFSTKDDYVELSLVFNMNRDWNNKSEFFTDLYLSVEDLIRYEYPSRYNQHF